ncbi:hypothetical protein CKO28_11785 [Rhodovibrio sodomensis]|uniref:Uncharacterized protein n=1 Tax=Rhodovibrio sodomensis TaxID=1088 RepID=A0ABS1DE63_9PROT|nr:hypothetical protein [Rhodovibrio sodomensis]
MRRVAGQARPEIIPHGDAAVLGGETQLKRRAAFSHLVLAAVANVPGAVGVGDLEDEGEGDALAASSRPWAVFRHGYRADAATLGDLARRALRLDVGSRRSHGFRSRSAAFPHQSGAQAARSTTTKRAIDGGCFGIGPRNRNSRSVLS